MISWIKKLISKSIGENSYKNRAIRLERELEIARTTTNGETKP